MQHFNLQEPRIKKFITIGAGILVMLLALLTLNSLWDLFDQWGITSSYDEARTITLSAQGKATVTPDTARFTASVVTRGDSAEAVQGQNSEEANAVISFLKEQGVADEDIKTVSYNLRPQYNFIDGQRIFDGYFLEQTLQVTVRDIARAGALLSGAVNAGANQVSSLQLFIDDPNEYKQQAREEAFAQAEEKARAMVEQAGVRLGKVVSFSESSGGLPGPVFLESADSLGRGGAAPAVEPGSQEVQVTVSVTYEIK